MSRRSAFAIIAVLAFAVASGCDSSGSSKGKDPGAASQATDDEQSGERESESNPNEQADNEESGEKAIDVPKEGEKFEPSVAASRMPKGAWHCNMSGKVHYAAMEKGNGKCPVCNMKLEKK